MLENEFEKKGEGYLNAFEPKPTELDIEKAICDYCNADISHKARCAKTINITTDSRCVNHIKLLQAIGNRVELDEKAIERVAGQLGCIILEEYGRPTDRDKLTAQAKTIIEVARK